jgi:peptidoglycan-N-acetylglucosamine deacetylase
MMTRFAAMVFGGAGFLFQCFSAPAAACNGNGGGIGVSRTISTDAKGLPRVGTLQYVQTLPLADKEIVLTFDDGPLPPHTNRILDILSRDCIKATYFIVGGMARAYPDTVRRIFAEGHTIGTHSQNHPLVFNRMSVGRVQAEVEDHVGCKRAGRFQDGCAVLPDSGSCAFAGD